MVVLHQPTTLYKDLAYYSCSSHDVLYHTTCVLTRRRNVYGGDEGARTPDLGSAIAALFQLSYIPLMK